MSLSLNQIYNIKADPHPFACKGALHDHQYSEAANAGGKAAPKPL